MSVETLRFDAVIVGGGAVGLACAFELTRARPNLQILLLEKHDRFGMETTARNSEVIHAGIYYPAGSWKECLCIEGKDLLYRFCAEHDVPHRRCEKLIVGLKGADESYLSRIEANATRNSVPLEVLTEAHVRELEPRIKAEIGLLSPTTGIVCSESFTQTLARLSEANGATLVRNSTVASWRKDARGYVLEVVQPGEQSFQVEAPVVINSAGLGAYSLADQILAGNRPFTIRYVRGHYFSLKEKYRNITNRLIYPIPDIKGGGLGIHLTLDLDGYCRLGPDTDWSKPDSPDFAFRDEAIPALTEKFLQAARAYLPELQNSDLSPGFVGVRPKAVAPDGTMLDFYIEEESARGFPGWINLLGIESPGLTSSLAIARKVNSLI